jgi:recombination protein RecA
MEKPSNQATDEAKAPVKEAAKKAPAKASPFAKQDPERLRAVDMALEQIEKQFGKGAIMRLDKDSKLNVESIPTGSLSLDLALGVGGIPKGRIVEIYGPESSGKTTLASHMVAEVQKQGGVAAFIDAEHAFDPEYGKNLGIDIDQLLISQPDTGEQALDIAETLVRSNGVDIIVIDSVAALTPRAEIEGDMGDSHMGLQARLMSQALRKLTGAISRSRATVIFINQIRMKIGVMFGNPETTAGGNALKFYSSVRLDVRRVAQLKEQDNVIGNRTRVKVVKNKVAAPFRMAEFDIMYGAGISREGDILDLAVDKEIVGKAGAWYEYADEKIGQGREAAKQYLKDHPKVADQIEQKVREQLQD